MKYHDSIAAYENNVETFLQYRDQSKVGVDVTRRWARSLKSGAEVIELACGGGLPVTQTLSESGLKLWAVEASPSLVSVFSGRFPTIPVACGSVLDNDYFDRQFDAAIAIGLLFLLNQKDQFKLLHTVSDILRPGGSFLFTAPLEIGTWIENNTGHQCLSLGDAVYRQALQKAGFRVLDCYEDRGKNNYYQVEKLGV